MIHLVAMKRMKSLKQLLKDTISDHPGNLPGLSPGFFQTLTNFVQTQAPRLSRLSSGSVWIIHEFPHWGSGSALLCRSVHAPASSGTANEGSHLERQVPLTSLCLFLHSAGRQFLPYLWLWKTSSCVSADASNWDSTSHTAHNWQQTTQTVKKKKWRLPCDD